jgi:hypothetical protein
MRVLAPEGTIVAVLHGRIPWRRDEEAFPAQELTALVGMIADFDMFAVEKHQAFPPA